MTKDKNIYGTGRIHADKKEVLKIRSEKGYIKKTHFKHGDKIRLEYIPDKKELIIKRIEDLY